MMADRFFNIFNIWKGSTMSKQMSVEDIRKTVTPTVLLRTPRKEKVEEYQEVMKNGTVMPPLTIGWNKKAPTQKVLVDGMTRLLAAEALGIKELAVNEKEYASPDLLLMDMYALNKHGAPIEPQDRDKRIVMLAGEPYNWPQVRIAKEFSLDQSSVSRIVSGGQKAGVATGEAKSRKKFTAMNGKQVIQTAARMAKSIKLKPVKGDLAELCYIGPITDKPNPKNAERLDVLKDLFNELKNMFEHLEKAVIAK